ncbi:T9SS type A sorting domain-containing protein [Flavobacterium pallidum]|nr:T9SS type A sorting domain-containing protein [Flavobacterium pallidum]
MKKLYTLSLVLFASAASFAQFYSESFGTPTGTTLFPAYATGTAPATFDNGAPIVYGGNADVRITGASSGYAGATGSGNAFIGTAAGVGKVMQIDGLDTSAYNSADLVLSFGMTISNNGGNPMILEQSTDATNWSPIAYTAAATGWNLVSIGGGAIESSGTLSLRFTNPGGTAQVRIDDISLSEGAVTPACSLIFGTVAKSCDAITSGTDTYTVTIPFTGGGTNPYTLNVDSGSIGGDDPTSMDSGNIVITGIAEGTAIVFTAEGGDCNLTVNVTSPDCTPAPTGVTLPYTNNFAYAAGATLSAQPDWTIQSGTTDEIMVAAGNLDYTGIASVGNSITFDGTGIDNAIIFDTQTSGTVYYSFLLNISSMTGVTEPNGGYFAGLGSSGTNFGATLWSKAVSDTSFNLGTEVRTASGTNTSWAADTYQTGQTYFAVLGYTFGDAATASDDTVNLWIDPTVGGAQPATSTIGDAHTGADLASINRFFFRQDSATETPGIQIDALRIGTTWESVTASNLSIKDNNIAGLKVYPNPVSNGTFFIETAANAEKAVVVYDVLGKQVVNTTTTTNAINVSNLKGGVYIVKITENGNTATRKMVIK